MFSRLGSTILFVLAFLLAGLGAFRLSLAEVADWIFDRPRYEYEPEEEPERPRRSKREERPAAPEPVRPPPAGRTSTSRWRTAPWWARRPRPLPR